MCRVNLFMTSLHLLVLIIVIPKIWSPETNTIQSHTTTTSARRTVGKIIPVQSGRWLHPRDDTGNGKDKYWNKV